MLPSPQVGQFVRLEDYKGRLIVKAVSDDGGLVHLVSGLHVEIHFTRVARLNLAN